MKFLYSDDTIVACSTCNHAHAAISVVRISGFKLLKDFQSFFTTNLSNVEPRRVYFTGLHHQGEKFDDICLTYFQGPHSYNGENILELSLHGNTLNTERVLRLFVEHGGCRLASPGEFTYRALKNKKLSLSQVEGLDLFLNANSGYALDQGLSLLSGNLQESYQELFDLYLKHKSSVELFIDFSEDVGEEVAKKHFDESLLQLHHKLTSLFKRTQALESNLLRPEIVLAGLPNAGKSSFFNRILSDERAIVSDIAGTTRDFISESLVIEGVKYKLVDTAGVRHSHDPIEAEGVRRTMLKMQQGFFNVLLINPFETDDGLCDLLNEDFDLIYFTHSDGPNFQELKDKLVKQYPKLGSIGAINLKQPLAEWEASFFSLINKKYLATISHKPILLDRHKYLISHAKLVCDHYLNLSQSETDIAILSSELNSLGHCISELIGIVSPEQILNSIFSNFCIGK